MSPMPSSTRRCTRATISFSTLSCARVSPPQEDVGLREDRLRQPVLGLFERGGAERNRVAEQLPQSGCQRPVNTVGIDLLDGRILLLVDVLVPDGDADRVAHRVAPPNSSEGRVPQSALRARSHSLCTFTPIVIEIDLATLTATSQTASGALESGPILMAFVQNPLGTEAAAGYMTGGDITAPIFCTSQAEVDALCMIEPIFCGAICVVVPGSPYDAATGEINLVGSEEQQGCNGAVCGGPFVLFTPRGDLRLTEPLVQGVPSLGPGAGLLLGALLTVSAGYALRSPSTLALRA